MGITSFFFDTYAFYELITGNKAYIPYRQEIKIVTTKLNLMELYYGLLLKQGKAIAEQYYNLFLPFTVEIEDISIKEACEYKAAVKQKKLSYIDCVGYMIAQKMNIKFLTGDRQFEGLANVEFVK